jgi:hypothetical protein
MVSLKDKLSQMLVNDDLCESLEYRHDQFGEDPMNTDEYTDIFSGSVYQDLLAKGCRKNKHDVINT